LTKISPLAAGDPDNFDLDEGQSHLSRGRVPADFLARRHLVSFSISSQTPFLDVRIEATATAEALSTDAAMNSILHRIDRPRIKPGDFVGNDRSITQAIALWAFLHGFAGLIYTSSHDLNRKWNCWAVFPSAQIVETGKARKVSLDDPALRSITSRFNLEVG
jgi:hypothetical protein